MNTRELVQVPSFRGYKGATLHLDINAEEHERRQAAGLGAIHRIGLLHALLTLPAGMPVQEAQLALRDRAHVRRAPAGIVDRAHGMVTRQAVRPCRITLATVRTATCSKTALESAGRFAPMCARAVIARIRPAMPETLIEFDFWGVGIYLEHPDGVLETLVEPAPWVPKRHTPAGWSFTEQAYAAYLTRTATPERTRT